MKPPVRCVAACVLMLMSTGCRGAADSSAAPPTAAPTVAVGSGTPSVVRDGGIDPTATAGAVRDESTATAPAVTVAATVPITVVEVAEVGVPGLDSADAFCAAWSRFAGSFQVVAVTAAFGSGTPEQLAALEVASSPVVVNAYRDLLANWPDELSSEADVVADDFLGPFARRMEAAHDSLDAVGADDAAKKVIADAWLTGLARRDPSTPEFAVDLPDEAWALIDTAALEFAARLVPFTTDPSLVTNVQTPLTSAYLAISCPDQGTLSGQEVDAG